MDQEQALSQILQKIDQVSDLYYRLILVISDQGDGASEIARRMDLPVVNVNGELSKRLLDLTQRQRTLQTNKLMSQIVSDVEDKTVLLDNIQLLFDRSLRQDPLRLLQDLARNKTIVVNWPGKVIDGQLTYAEQGHPEFRRYPTRDIVLIE